MNLRTIIILGLALLSGLGTVVGVKKMQSANQAQAEVETVGVVVAAADLPKLDLLEPDDLVVKPWPKDFIPTGAIQSVDEIVGKTLRQSKKAEQPIFQSDIDSGRGVDVLIPDGEDLRLTSILTPSEANNVAGLVQPGDHVDINLILSARQRSELTAFTGGAHASLLLQNVLVVSVGQQIEITKDDKVARPYQSVTVAVTPQQSLILQLAGSKGTLTLTLRKSGDGAIVETNPITLAELRSLNRFGNPSNGAMLADGKAAEKQVTVYRRIRTQRGRASGQVYFRTQEIRSFVPRQSDADQLTAGLGSSKNVNTP